MHQWFCLEKVPETDVGNRFWDDHFAGCSNSRDLRVNPSTSALNGLTMLNRNHIIKKQHTLYNPGSCQTIFKLMKPYISRPISRTNFTHRPSHISTAFIHPACSFHISTSAQVSSRQLTLLSSYWILSTINCRSIRIIIMVYQSTKFTNPINDCWGSVYVLLMNNMLECGLLIDDC